MLPYSSSRGRQAAPPEATTETGCAPLNQLHTSMLWRCCSTIWSPQIHRKEYQLRCCHSRSPHLGSRFLLGKSLALRKFSTGVPTQLASMCTMSPISPSRTRLYRSRYQVCERRWAPDLTVSLSSWDFLAAAMKRRMPVAAGGVVAHGLFAEDVLFGLDRGLEVQWAMPRIGGQHHDIDIARHQLLVS